MTVIMSHDDSVVMRQEKRGVGPLDSETLRRVHLIFRSEDRDAAAAILGSTDFGLTNNLARTRFALLKLSGGNLEALRHWRGVASLDWRDAVVAAGFGDRMDAHAEWLALTGQDRSVEG